ncbi:MAG: hypothetical protein IPL61_26130 [Myxococcales bacterium]|nr:hypothetical protein [Myxococcales bacterium]
MLGLALIVGAALFGRGAVRRLGWTLTPLETVALAAALALTAAPWCWFLASWALGFALGLPLATAALAGLGLALGRGVARRPGPALPGTSALSWAALALVLALGFHGHMLHVEGGGLYSGGSTWGDLALHATLANHFASGPVDLRSPITAGAPLTYPFLGDFLVACLVRGGWSLSTAFALTGWATAMTGFALIQAVAVRLFRRRAAATIAVWLIVLSGSAVGLWYAVADLRAHGAPAELARLPSYANDPARGLVWSNFVADLLLPQRALLAALPAAWAAVWALRAGAEDEQPRAPLVAAVLIGALPLVHVHSFIVLMGLLALTVAVRTARMGRAARPWWLALAVAGALAAPQLAWQLGGGWHASFGGWRLGWLAPRGAAGFGWFWLRSLGALALLAPVTALVTWRRGRGSYARVLGLGALGLFVTANLYQFQPNAWDNIKLLAYAFMFGAVLTAGALAALLERGALARGAVGVVLIAATGAGALTLARELDQHDQLASTADLALARQIRAVVPARARVLTADQHNHVVPMLAGRAIVMGYRGWQWTHGHDTRALERDERAIFQGAPGAARLIEHLGVTHVYVGPGEVRDFGADRAWFRARYPAILTVGEVEIFDVRSPPPWLARRVTARRS